MFDATSNNVASFGGEAGKGGGGGWGSGSLGSFSPKYDPNLLISDKARGAIQTRFAIA